MSQSFISHRHRAGFLSQSATSARADLGAESRSSRYGLIAALVVVGFLTASHLPILPERLRLQLMVGLSAFAALMVFFRHQKLRGTPTVALVSLAVLVQAAVLSSTLISPPLTRFAENKQVLFFAVFSTCFVLFPLLLATTRNGLDKLAQLLVLMSLLFAALAFTAPTGENLRRSGIELNPILLAKLLYFPGILLIARTGTRFRGAQGGPSAPRGRTSRSVKFFGSAGKHETAILLGLAIFGVLASLQTASRSPIVVFGLVYVLDQLVVFSERRLRYLPVVVFTAMVGIVGYLSIAPSFVRERFTFASFSNEGDEGSRVYLMELASSNIASNFTSRFFGIGLGNFSALTWVNAPHNVVLEAVLELGVIGSIPLLVLLVWAFAASIRVLRTRDVAMRFVGLWFLFFLMMSLIGGELTFSSMLLYVPAGILIYSAVAGRDGSGSAENKRGYSSGKGLRSPSSRSLATTKRVTIWDGTLGSATRRYRPDGGPSGVR